MLYITLGLWTISALLILFEKRNMRMILYMGIFGMFSSLAFFLLGSPDVAMAEAAISSFTIIFFIVCLEKYYWYGMDLKKIEKQEARRKRKTNVWIRYILPLIFTLFSFGLFVYFIPDNIVNSYLKELYLGRFMEEVGGYNPVTAIYLRYRVYDTLFEALMLLVGIVAVVHLSHYEELVADDGKHSDIRRSDIAVVTIRLICPLMVLFCIYLVMNGHLTAGGGFQGGVVAASLFVCRYLIHDIYDIPTDRVITFEKLIFAGILLLAVLFIFVGLKDLFPMHRNVYLVAMNLLIGLKVACGFFIVFYRFIAFERR